MRRGVAVQLQKVLSSVATRAASKEFFYTRFFAIGVFRLLELTDTRDPKALEGVVKVRPPLRLLLACWWLTCGVVDPRCCQLLLSCCVTATELRCRVVALGHRRRHVCSCW